MGMQEQKFEELETRAADVGVRDSIHALEARARVAREIESMKAEGKAIALSDEEMDMLQAFRRFKLRMRKNGEMFTWQSRMPEGFEIVNQTAEILTPAEAGTL